MAEAQTSTNGIREAFRPIAQRIVNAENRFLVFVRETATRRALRNSVRQFPGREVAQPLGGRAGRLPRDHDLSRHAPRAGARDDLRYLPAGWPGCDWRALEGRLMRSPASQHCKIVVQLDQAAHIKLAQLAEASDRTIRDQARFLLKKALGLLPAEPGEGT